MKKITTIFILVLLFGTLNAQKEVTITGVLNDCTYEKIFFFDHEGVVLRALGEIPIKVTDGVGTFNFKTWKLSKGFYFVGSNERNYKIMLLGEEDNVQIKGNAAKLNQAQVLNSPQNEAYFRMMGELQKIQQSYQQLLGQYRGAAKNPTKLAALDVKMKAIDQQKVNYLATVKKADAYLHKVASLQTYLSYQTYKKEGQAEADYFAENYFKLTDLNDDTYQMTPHILDAFKSYAFTLASVGLPDEKQQNYVTTLLNKMPKTSKTHKMALAGVMLGFVNKNSNNFVHFGKQFIQQYGKDNQSVTQYFNNQITQVEAFTVGKVAPDITQTNPKGEQQKLSDLRGKVVLIDFWASWCGPCRKENPRVKELYSKYKSKGFDIYAVSLDRTKASWLNAIAKDGLPWHHVSDLKGWKNEAAVRYGVTSIPQTVLLDEQGRIIARNLRGEPLERKLEELFSKSRP